MAVTQRLFSGRVLLRLQGRSRARESFEQLVPSGLGGEAHLQDRARHSMSETGAFGDRLLKYDETKDFGVRLVLYPLQEQEE